uniref:Uncharacterized protein n=1 Tax=Salix viminalis TaxID=40686 RepID=A0A6N2JZW8_SALVM
MPRHSDPMQVGEWKFVVLVKCCKSTCKVTSIRDLLVCHHCFDKAFDKFYDMYTATWIKFLLFYAGRLNQYLYFLIAGKELGFPLSPALFAVKITLNAQEGTMPNQIGGVQSCQAEKFHSSIADFMGRYAV